MSETWYPYGEASSLFRRHVHFICENLMILKSGRWPSEHRETGYSGGPGSQRVATEAKFTKPVEIAAEVEIRLSKCNSDGILALGYYRGEVNMDWLCEWEDCQEADIERRMNRAIAYAGSGPCPRWKACKECPEFAYCTLLKRKRIDDLAYKEDCNRNQRRPDFLGVDYKTWCIRKKDKWGKEHVQ